MYTRRAKRCTARAPSQTERLRSRQQQRGGEKNGRESCSREGVKTSLSTWCSRRGIAVAYFKSQRARNVPCALLKEAARPSTKERGDGTTSASIRGKGGEAAIAPEGRKRERLISARGEEKRKPRTLYRLEKNEDVVASTRKLPCHGEEGRKKFVARRWEGGNRRCIIFLLRRGKDEPVRGEGRKTGRKGFRPEKKKNDAGFARSQTAETAHAVHRFPKGGGGRRGEKGSSLVALAGGKW